MRANKNNEPYLRDIIEAINSIVKIQKIQPKKKDGKVWEKSCVIPLKKGIQLAKEGMDSRLRGNDRK